MTYIEASSVKNQITSPSEIEGKYYENDKEFGLNFKKPINPATLIDAIKKIDRTAGKKKL